MADAGFSDTVIVETIVGNGLLPTFPADALSDLATACEDATPLEHSHEFTADGRFFSYDQNGQEVDSGNYALVDEDTLTINDVTLDFAIA